MMWLSSFLPRLLMHVISSPSGLLIMLLMPRTKVTEPCFHQARPFTLDFRKTVLSSPGNRRLYGRAPLLVIKYPCPLSFLSFALITNTDALTPSSPRRGTALQLWLPQPAPQKKRRQNQALPLKTSRRQVYRRTKLRMSTLLKPRPQNQARSATRRYYRENRCLDQPRKT
jgi:hypothetical protein